MMKWWDKLIKWIAQGSTRQYYTELYTWGAIDREEFLRLIEETEDE